MRFYNQPHSHYCGIDLHARSMYCHILDQHGQTVFERDLPAAPAPFLDAVAPFRDGIVVGCECMFAWYWLADLCAEHDVPFVLGHALYMKAIHPLTLPSPSRRLTITHKNLARGGVVS